MKKSAVQFVCSSCGYESVQWYGKCPNCAEWNTMREFRNEKRGSKRSLRAEEKKREESTKPQKLSEIKIESADRISSGIEELDRVLGGGFVPGEVVLLAGEPGVGKSTLLLGLARNKNERKIVDFRSSILNSILYVSGEESPEQIKTRAMRLGISGENIVVSAETQIERIIESAKELINSCGLGCEISDEGREEKNLRSATPYQLSLLIIDSVQTLWSDEIEGSPGSISQVKWCTQKLIEFAKKNALPIILIGQINKEGEIAGPMILSHMVDCVLFLEGERFSELRLLRGLKNRFGPTDEVGVFNMTDRGMAAVTNPSVLFLQRNEEGKQGVKNEKGEIGSVAICALEGTRPMLLEVQALVTESVLPVPRRVVLGLDYNRVMLLIAVLQKTLHLPLYKEEIIVKIAGGFKISEPAADLGVALAIISSFQNKPIKPKTCVFGEIGLLGEIRRVNGEEKRVKEARKLGFTNILSSQTVSNLREAVKAI